MRRRRSPIPSHEDPSHSHKQPLKRSAGQRSKMNARLTRRRPDYAVGNLVGSGRHTISDNWLQWDVSYARSRMLQSGGNGGSKFKWNGPATNCENVPASDPDLPQFSPSCFTPGPTNVEDIANYKLTSWSPASVGESAQTNWQGAASGGHLYHAGGHAGSLEFGGKYRDAHKYNDSYTTTYTVTKGVTVPIAQFAGTFVDPKYYEQNYPWPSQNVDYEQVQTYVQSHSSQFVVTGGPGVNKSDFDLTERVGAGYVMNTIDLSSAARLMPACGSSRRT